MDQFECTWCGLDLLTLGAVSIDQHLEECEPYRRVFFPEEFNDESPLCDGDEE